MVLKWKRIMLQKLTSENSRDSVVIMFLATLVFVFMIWSILHTA